MADAATAATILTTPPSATTATTTQVAPEGTGSANSPAWYESVPDPELKGFLSNKKFASPTELAVAYRNLEGVFGADKAGRTILRPNDQMGPDGKLIKRDEAGWSAFNKAIGVPEKPEDYALPVPEGDDGAFAKTAAQWMHKAGVPKGAASVVAEQWNAFIGEQVKAGKEAEQVRAVEETNKLREEWGASYDANVELSQRGLRAVAKLAGLDTGENGDLERLQQVLGPQKLMKMFAAIGNTVKESGFAGGDGSARFSQSIDDAQAKINEYQLARTKGEINDYTWNNEYMAPGGKIDQLMQIITGGSKAA